MAVLKALGRDRSIGMWCKTADLDEYPEAGWIGGAGPKDAGSITWKFKSISGATPQDQLTPTEVKNIEDKNGNLYLTVAGAAITEQGVLRS